MTRLKKGAERTVMPLILVKVPQDQKRIFDTVEVCNMRVKMEPLRRNGGVGQCQKFGHTQVNCTGTPRCLKCAEGHTTAECKRSRDEPPKCANCGSDHPANTPICSKNPNKTRKREQKIGPQNRRDSGKPNNAHNTTATALSYSEALRGTIMKESTRIGLR